MSRALCTYCSAPKREDPGLLPAHERYLSRRIRLLALRAAWERRPFLILSGEYGLITPDHPIPWYDHLLIEDEIDDLVPRLVTQLLGHRLDVVEYHTAPLATVAEVRPYFDALSAACTRAEVELEIRILPADLP